MTEFATSLDICNRALQRVGARLLQTLNDNTKSQLEVTFAYDKLRVSEIRARPWRWAIREATLRPYTLTTKRMIPPAWNAGSISYAIGSVVQDANGIYWVAKVANTSSSTNGPGTLQVGQPANWTQFFGPVFGDFYSPAVQYFANEIVYTAGEPDLWYISLGNNNINNAVTNTAYWTPLNATDLPVNFMIPAGPGVVIDDIARNIYPLPNGYLRPLNPSPKIAGGSTLATSAALRQLDWQIESDFFISASNGPLTFRFCADISDVRLFDVLFAESLSARIAWDVCEALTQSPVKLQACANAYAMLLNRAIQVNALEIGSTESDDDIYLDIIGPASVIDRQATPPAPQQGGR